MRVLMTFRAKHPASHDNVIIHVSAHRDVLMVRPNGGDVITSSVTSKVISLDHFTNTIIGDYGPIKGFETYMDASDGMQVVRGIVHHEGVQKCFYQRFDELTQNILDDVMRSFDLTMRMEKL